MSATSGNPGCEPAWKTYLLGVIFVLPAVVTWGFSCIYVVPKVREICGYANLDDAQAGWLLQVTLFLVGYARTILLAGIVLFVLLELVGRGWRKLRRLSVNIAVWLANVTILFGMSSLVILTVIAASMLVRAK